MLRATVLGAALAVLWAWPSGARATTMVYRSVEALYEMSDLVARGTVEGGRSFWGEDGGLRTDWRFAVREVLRGPPVPREVVVRQMGGAIDGLSLRIPGDAELRIGEHVVLFLRGDRSRWYLTAMGQSKLSVSLGGTPGAGDEPVSHLSRVQGSAVRDLSQITFYSVGDEKSDHPGARLYALQEAELFTLASLRAMGQDVNSARRLLQDAQRWWTRVGSGAGGGVAGGGVAGGGVAGGGVAGGGVDR